jgi:Iron permease FTR1 family
MVNVFAVPVFFICFRECLETSIIVSILLALLKGSLENKGSETPYKRLVRQVCCQPFVTKLTARSGLESASGYS